MLTPRLAFSNSNISFHCTSIAAEIAFSSSPNQRLNSDVTPNKHMLLYKAKSACHYLLFTPNLRSIGEYGTKE